MAETSRMPVSLLDRISENDTIEEMEFAWQDRYWDSLTCALEERGFAAGYLMGYAIEMLLKSAYFRFQGVAADDDLRPHLRRERGHPHFAPKASTRKNRASGLHDIAAWADHLIAERARAGRALDALLAGRLLYEMGWVADNWSELLRYRRSIPVGEEIDRLLAVADWLTANHPVLWR